MRRVLAIVKNSIVKCRDSRLRRASVEAVTGRLQAFAQSTLHGYTLQEEESPKRVGLLHAGMGCIIYFISLSQSISLQQGIPTIVP